MELEDNYTEFWEDLIRQADAYKETQAATFFEIYSNLASENGDSGDLEYCPVRKEGNKSYQIDGFILDAEQGELVLAICDFRPNSSLESLNASHIDSAFKKARRFFENSLKEDFILALEESSPAFQAAIMINQYASQIRRVKFLLLSNAKFVSRKKEVPTIEEQGRTYALNILDFSRYVDIQSSRTGSEPIDLDIQELNNGKLLPCIKANMGGAEYESYLIVMPAPLLADIYSSYGARLLEQNVRTFLQARTKTNKGIIQTIKLTPEMFFAYNNGLTATASNIEIKKNNDDTCGISSISDLQIVNGGQTTASILYARDKERCDLSQVFIQVKLSILKEDKISEIVPNISKYANSQNTISPADLFASHPFHIRLEKISRRLFAPQRENMLTSSKWFYERARGQFKDKQSYMTASNRKKFLSEFPSEQLIVKTDLAKYELAYISEPHVVCLGAQKCFLNFAQIIDQQWQKNDESFNEIYFKEAISKAILFKWTDKMISQAEWYKNDRGYKSQIVAYTVALLTFSIKKTFSKELDLQLIWNKQELPIELRRVLKQLAINVATEIKQPPSEVRNIGEYCKRKFCFDDIKKKIIPNLGILEPYLIDKSESIKRKQEAKKNQKLDNEIEIEITIANLLPQWNDIRSYSNSNDLLTPNRDRAIGKILRGNFELTKTEKTSLRDLLVALKELQYPLPEN